MYASDVVRTVKSSDFKAVFVKDTDRNWNSSIIQGGVTLEVFEDIVTGLGRIVTTSSQEKGKQIYPLNKSKEMNIIHYITTKYLGVQEGSSSITDLLIDELLTFCGKLDSRYSHISIEKVGTTVLIKLTNSNQRVEIVYEVCEDTMVLVKAIGNINVPHTSRSSNQSQTLESAISELALLL